jgi:hypothetical protein
MKKYLKRWYFVFIQLSKRHLGNCGRAGRLSGIGGRVNPSRRLKEEQRYESKRKPVGMDNNVIVFRPNFHAVVRPENKQDMA